MKNKTNVNQANYILKIKINLIKNKIKKMQGFTLVELMVAIAISIIVLIAASSTFIITYRLNDEVKTRIRTEEDLRNAADLLRTDTRKLGDFRCQYGPTPEQLNDDFKGAFANVQNKQFLSTTHLSDYKPLGITASNNSNPLLITYIADNGYHNITGEDCNKPAEKINASVYLVGTTAQNPTPGLYKVNYDSVYSSWSAPQLIVSNVEKMDLTFYYDKHKESDCPKTLGDTIESDVQESNSGTILTEYANPPILIKATLKVCPTTGQCTDSVIQAMARKGEVCS